MGPDTQGSYQAPKSNSGAKWTLKEENFLVINAMDPNVSNDWLLKNLPGGNARSINSISGHFNDMRLKGRLSRSWRAKHWNHDRPWTIEEDAEILLWNVSGRAFIDTEKFCANDRAGGAVLEREKYLCQDRELVETVAQIEERLRLILLEHDMINAEADRVMIRQAAIEVRREEKNSIDEIYTAIRDSLKAREVEEPGHNDENDKGKGRAC
ncbi:uncharacterized protein CIMG_06984 [Coccidioides immitis RS]|uniref:Uncharacterized protein n=1 Tax=Coccidioides immitis (strain RS) TaxID=246410 RepID=J3K9D8_COCIM|nr:uncharacterized protein CIMG_06984 [Coccidioides immitis RS]EAS31505.3 hypothetical protein CIMG_06984 [Coccidioides immitis RS]